MTLEGYFLLQEIHLYSEDSTNFSKVSCTSCDVLSFPINDGHFDQCEIYILHWL